MAGVITRSAESQLTEGDLDFSYLGSMKAEHAILGLAQAHPH